MKPTPSDEKKYSLTRVSPTCVQERLGRNHDIDSLAGVSAGTDGLVGVLFDDESEDHRHLGMYLMSGGITCIKDSDVPSLHSILLGAGRGIVPSRPGYDFFFVGDGAASYLVLESWHAFELVMQERPVLRVSRFDFDQDLFLLGEAESHPDSHLVRGISLQAQEYTTHLIRRLVQAPDGGGIRLWRAMKDVELDLDSGVDRLIERYKSRRD